MFCRAIAVKSRHVCGSWTCNIDEAKDLLCPRHYNLARTKGVKLDDDTFLKLENDGRRPCDDCGKRIKCNNHKLYCDKSLKNKNLTNT